MALIAFLMDIEEGHLIPSLKLAHSLRRMGHEVVYISVPDNERMVLDQGFKFFPMFEEIYPAGFQRSNKELIKEQGYQHAVTEKYHFELMLTGSFPLLREQLNPDLYIVSCFLTIEALILHYRFGLEPVIFTPYLRQKGIDTAAACMDEILKMSTDESIKLIGLMNQLGLHLNSMNDLVAPVRSFCEVIACPLEFEIGHPLPARNTHYLGPSIMKRKEREDRSDWEISVKDKKIIYASLGSQARMYGRVGDIFYQTVLQVMESTDMQDFHLILSIGAENEKSSLLPAPGNVTIIKWAPQLDILKKASLAIIHGGLGTIKECICFGVPMIVFPLDRDQPMNAKRIEYHQLGLNFPMESITVDKLSSAIVQVLKSDLIKAKIARMQKIFLEKEEADPGVSIIERLLISAGKGAGSASGKAAGNDSGMAFGNTSGNTSGNAAGNERIKLV